MFTGIVLIVVGAAVGCSEVSAKKDGGYLYRFGAWKDINVAAGVSKEAAPWLIGVGAMMLVVSYVTRER